MLQHACERTSQQVVRWHPERSRMSGASHKSELSIGELNGTCGVSTMLLLMAPHQRPMPMPS